MPERCNGCMDRSLSGDQECTGLLQTLSVDSGVENYTVQVCTSPALAEIPARFHETVRNGTGTIVVHQQVELSQAEATTIAQGFDL